MTFSIRTLITRLFGRPSELAIPMNLWRQLLCGLVERGGGYRESGAFLLGPSGEPRRVSAIVFYDEIDPAAFETGIIEIDGGHMAELWRICRELQLAVVADVHTHPGSAMQSDSDRRHPIIAEPGHIALILPNFAAEPLRLRDVGFYRYLGGFRWTSSRSSL